MDQAHEHRAAVLEQAVRELHEILYPERYWDPEELERRGLVVQDGHYQWSPTTPELIAERLDQIHDAYGIPGWVAEPKPRR
jgi:hypothetical protein